MRQNLTSPDSSLVFVWLPPDSIHALKAYECSLTRPLDGINTSREGAVKCKARISTSRVSTSYWILETLRATEVVDCVSSPETSNNVSEMFREMTKVIHRLVLLTAFVVGTISSRCHLSWKLRFLSMQFWASEVMDDLRSLTREERRYCLKCQIFQQTSV